MRGKAMLGCGVVLASCLLLVPTASAQEFGEVSEAFRLNLDSMRGYSWTSTIEFHLDGMLRSTEVYRMHLDSERKIHRELISSEGKKSKSQEVAETTRSSLVSLIDGYTHMKPENLEKIFGDNPRAVLPGEGDEPTQIHASGVVSTGDSLKIWVDNATYRVQKLELDTQLQGIGARLLAEFEKLESGPSFPMRSTLWTRHKKKSLMIVTVNSDPARSN